MADFPNWNPATAVASIYCSAGWVSTFQDNLSSFQTAMRDAMGTFSTLASYLHVEQATGGGFESLYHASVLGVTASQHHNKLHATSHITGASDAIPVASANTRGLMGSAQFVKLSNVVASATKNRFSLSSYTGRASAVTGEYQGAWQRSEYQGAWQAQESGGGGVQTVSLGWQPDMVIIWKTGSDSTSFEYIYGADNVIHHTLTAGTGAHSCRAAASLIQTNANGFTVKGSCNATSIAYKYWAIKEH